MPGWQESPENGKNVRRHREPGRSRRIPIAISAAGGRRMATVSIPRDQVVDGSLLSVCVVCGADAPHRRFSGVGAPSLAWILFSPLMGLVTLWAYILFAGGATGGGLPFCDRHRGYWPRRAWF